MTLAPGIHVDIPEDVYHADPTGEAALSSSTIKDLLRSPLQAYWNHPRLNPSYEAAHSDAFDLGNAVHDLFLRGLDRMAVAPFDSWRTKEARAHRDAAREAGLIPLLEQHEQKVREMADALRDQIAAMEDDPPFFADGKPEATLVWRGLHDVLCRSRLDWLRDDLRAIDDLKSVGQTADPNEVSGDTLYGYAIQGRFYQRAVAALTGRTATIRFVLVETRPPYPVGVIEEADFGQSMLEAVDADIDYAFERWARCLATRMWPGYERRIVPAELSWRAAERVTRRLAA